MTEKPIPIPNELPILPVREIVLFPGGVQPLTVGREGSLALLNSLHGDEKLLGIVAQHDPRVEEPAAADLHTVGTAAKIHKLVKMPNGNVVVFLEGLQRIRVLEIDQLPAVPDGPRGNPAGHRRAAGRRVDGAGTQRARTVPRRRGAFAATFRRFADRGAEHRRSGPPGRFHRGQFAVASDAASPGIAGDGRRAAAPGDADPRTLEGTRSPGAAQQDSGAGAGASEPEPARISAARAAQGHSQGAGRIRRRPGRNRRASREAREVRHVRRRRARSATAS